MPGDPNQQLRENLLELLRGGGAHSTFDEIVSEVPPNLRGEKPPGQSHTPWRLIEHLRIAQRNILDFSRNPDYQALNWPDDYWPDGNAPASDEAWQESVAAFQSDLQAMQQLVSDRSTDLLAPIPWGQGQTIAREAMLLSDHNAYHLGQFATLRRLLGTPSEAHT